MEPTRLGRWILFLFILWMTPGHVSAQSPPLMQIYGPSHYVVNSYNGLVHNQVHRIHIQLRGPGIAYPNWSLKAKITQPLNAQPPNISGRTFPEEMLEIRFIDELFSGDPPYPRPTVQNLQLPLTGRPLQAAGIETPFVSNAAIPLATGSSYHVNIDYNFKLDIKGGRYLADMLSDIGGVDWNASPAIYRAGILFVLYDEHQQEVARSEYPIALQINRPLSDPPPDGGAAFHLELTGASRDGVLAFTGPLHYKDGNTVTYPDGVKVTATTGYQIQVKSMQGAFLNPQGKPLALDILNVRLSRTSGSPADAAPTRIRLSTESQLIVSSPSGGGHQPHYYNLEYATDANDARLAEAGPGKYTTLLLYELTPR